MSRLATAWHSDRLGREVEVVRWGEVGTPVLFFPTAAGDAQECERFLLVEALADLLAEGRIKLYSVDSVPGMVWLGEDDSASLGARVQAAYGEFVARELVPAIHADCGGEPIEIVAAGASIGAYEALMAILSYPDSFSRAICMSGTYDLSKFLRGDGGEPLRSISPAEQIPRLGGARLETLRRRFVLLTHGRGRWEEPAQSWRVADLLGAQGIPNRVDEWDGSWDHDWPTWRAMLPHYLRQELLP